MRGKINFFNYFFFLAHRTRGTLEQKFSKISKCGKWKWNWICCSFWTDKMDNVAKKRSNRPSRTELFACQHAPKCCKRLSKKAESQRKSSAHAPTTTHHPPPPSSKRSPWRRHTRGKTFIEKSPFGQLAGCLSPGGRGRAVHKTKIRWQFSPRNLHEQLMLGVSFFAFPAISAALSSRKCACAHAAKAQDWLSANDTCCMPQS